jgi:aminopeptidase N
MAHMWFGDLVTMRWWDDLWLNESFATYMASHALAQATRFERAWVSFATTIKGPAAVQDQLPTTHPISADIVDTDSVRLHFDGITYGKGASVLKQLVAWVGPDAFRTGVQGYFVEHEWSNAELTDFLAALEAPSGRDLGAWSKVWLETAGVNTLRPAFELDQEGRYRSLAVLQEATADHPTLRPHRLRVGAYVVDGDAVVRHGQTELDVVGTSTDVADLVGRPQPDLLLVNDDDLTYAKVRLDERSLDTLAAHLSGIADPLARNLCWAATWDMVRDAELATRRFVDLVLAHAGGEEDETVLASLLGRVVTAVNAFGDPDNRPVARARLASAAAAQLDGAEPGSDRQLIWARNWLATADDPEHLARARALLEGDAEVKGLAVDTDLRWAIVGVLATHGADDGGALIEAELRRDPTDIGERRAAAGRASRPTAEAKAEAWEKLIAGGTSLALARALVGGFAQFGQEELVRPYVDPYFDAVIRFWQERPREESLTLIDGLYPSVLVEDGILAATERLLALDSLPGPARRILLEAADGVRRAARARAADQG